MLDEIDAVFAFQWFT